MAKINTTPGYWGKDILQNLPPDFEIQEDPMRGQFRIRYKSLVQTIDYELMMQAYQHNEILIHVMRDMVKKYKMSTREDPDYYPGWEETKAVAPQTIPPPKRSPHDVSEGFKDKVITERLLRLQKNKQFEELKKAAEPPAPEGALDWDF